MKALVILLLLIAAGGATAWYISTYEEFDPTQQGQEAREAISPGMTWREVIEATTEPKKYCRLIKKEEEIAGEIIEMINPGKPINFTFDRFAERFEKGELPEGFVFRYFYSAKEAFAVIFDSPGTVVRVQKMATGRSLLQLDD